MEQLTDDAPQTAPIPVLDLFAGPGGLGEGFAAFRDPRDSKTPTFQLVASIEMDAFAHATLELRAFRRALGWAHVPGAYYDYLRGLISRDALFSRYPCAADRAKDETIKAELGKDDPYILERTDRAVGEYAGSDLVLIGGPPCQAYSVIGRSRRAHEPRDRFEADPKHRLYRHYLRMLSRYRPAVFVMENVRGLLSARLQDRSVFDQVLADLANPNNDAEDLAYTVWPIGAARPVNDGPVPSDFVVRSEKYGVPQARHRVILLGVRSDIQRRPRRLVPRRAVTVRDAISDLPALRSEASSRSGGPPSWTEVVKSACMTLMNQCPDLRTALERVLEAHVEQRQPRWPPSCTRPADALLSWFRSSPLPVICNHEARTHMPEDLERYLFAACYAQVHSVSPRLADFPPSLLPCHRSAYPEPTGFHDRFHVQLWDRPSCTITSHISKDGHYYIHPDPTQCRSLTVREAARLQTFPDDYFFEGPRTEQYKQVGNAVPPFLAVQIAGLVYDVLRGTHGSSV